MKGREYGLDALFGGDLKRALKRKLNFARGFFPRIAMCHDAGPFDDLDDKAFIAFSAEYQMRIS